MKALLTVEEAAVALKVREDTVRRWLRDGTLRGRKLGRIWRIPEGELQRTELIGNRLVNDEILDNHKPLAPGAPTT